MKIWATHNTWIAKIGNKIFYRWYCTCGKRSRFLTKDGALYWAKQHEKNVSGIGRY